MGSWFNQNSFLLVALFTEILAAWYFLRTGINTGNILRLLVVTAVIAAVFFGLRPSGSSEEEAGAFLARTGQGKPALLEFKSPN